MVGHCFVTRGSPVISGGGSIPMIDKTVGATSANEALCDISLNL